MFRDRVKPFIPRPFWSFAKSFYYKSIKTYYYGHRHSCPVCGSRLRKFLPAGLKLPMLKEKEVVGGGYASNIWCPICGSLDRTRLLVLYISQKTDLFQRPQRVLHFAPEKAIEERGRRVSGPDYLTADLYPYGTMIKVDITAIPFANDHFDAVICNHVLEHVPDDKKAMTEIYRVLKPGGWAILQVPLSLKLEKTYEDFSITSESAREQAFGQSDHVRLYGTDYQDRLRAVGFSVDVFHWTTEPENFGTRRNVYALNEKEAIYRVIKPTVS